ncbi:type I-G CRISPR-associated protein Csb2 [Amycolatopsis panacis]|uniref:Type I-U CRISPR-associated protein Cas5/Cas6 n=1 Tax=Amycolatopsis panacis TaxID=2340917 RepID=A0A419I7D8_9PSEU|nr:type I-U CRISPR-associated protein Csb2 [Amycolatopsis panacis]RJQ87486.1 type I-U CRISPR-associated protein Cas5/Cas6 [Amycolatopsis panacis]
MTITLALRFPWGRYHATPWGRHVNEGAVELPPSPWRILRALYAVWCTRAPDLDKHVVHALLDKLALPPTMFVPAHTIAHTRHYYPDSKHTAATASIDKTLDAFAVLDPDSELALQWHGLELTGPQRDALATLAASLPYLGRADSICEATLTDRWAPAGHDTWIPVNTAEMIPDNAEVTAVLAATHPLDLEALVARPVNVRKGGLLFPRGTRFAGYQKEPGAPRPRRQRRKPTVTAVRFAVAQRVRPPRADALIYTDLLRKAALRKLGDRRAEPADSLLGGKTAAGATTRDDHQHAHYLPLTQGRHLTGLLVWIPAGLGGDELDALTAVTQLRTGMNEKWRLTLRAADTGDIHDIAPELARPSRRWTSLTPLAPARYPKKKDWPDFLRTEIERELAYRGHNDLHVHELTLRPENAPFRQARPSAPARRRPSASVTVTLDREIAGPLTLGHLSHFGLGLFAPEP